MMNTPVGIVFSISIQNHDRDCDEVRVNFVTILDGAKQMRIASLDPTKVLLQRFKKKWQRFTLCGKFHFHFLLIA